jgi:hypothetical protein
MSTIYGELIEKAGKGMASAFVWAAIALVLLGAAAGGGIAYLILR